MSTRLTARLTARRAVTDAIGLGVLGGLAFIAALFVQSSQWRLALDAYLLYLGGLALLALTRLTRVATAAEHPSFLDEALELRNARPRQDVEQLPALARLEREVTLATTNVFDLHVRMRPTLREIAEYRLYDRHGVLLDERPDRAREILGESLWELVRPNREPPANRHGPGIRPRDLEAAVDTLERL